LAQVLLNCPTAIGVGRPVGGPDRMKRLWRDLREIVHEQLLYRDLLVEMARRDLLLRYKQTFMGAAWAVFMPLMNTAVFTVIFRRVAPIDVGIPYVLYAYSGLVVWNLFASSLKFSIGSLTTNMSLVTKVYFPREIFPISSVVVCLVDFAVAHILLAILMLYYRVPLSSAIIYLPIVLIVHLSFTIGAALLLSMCNLFYRDVKYLFDVLLMVWMFATSVLYPISLLGGRAAMIMQFNPMTPIVDGYRAALFTGETPLTFPFAVAAIVAAFTLTVSWVAFHRAEYRFAEIV
jgi:lipopolysaccharide transport system permease protein